MKSKEQKEMALSASWYQGWRQVSRWGASIVIWLIPQMQQVTSYFRSIHLVSLLLLFCQKKVKHFIVNLVHPCPEKQVRGLFHYVWNQHCTEARSLFHELKILWEHFSTWNVLFWYQNSLSTAPGPCKNRTVWSVITGARLGNITVQFDSGETYS